MDDKETNGECGSERGGCSDGAQGGSGAREGSYEGTKETDSVRCGENPMGEATRGYIYFFETRDGNYVKIGWSVNVPRRFYQVGLVVPGIRLLGYVPGSPQAEIWLHRTMREHRARGEWYYHNDVMRSLVTAFNLQIPLEAEQPECSSVRPPKNPAGRSLTVAELTSMGGKARAKSMTKAERSEAARKAVQARWAKKPAKKAKGGAK